ncbi:glutathione S-transferase 1-like [Agrilus planipennis]|uniref:Glutathione S-transferase 1-like n=1 Tax=Agrilus planipennis TaxID=224129 RepID=A0A1W4XDF2_AGRPL|nr:glutathione S-transferase 1-like [Agrilus planipennis]
MSILFYHCPLSRSSRGALLAARAIGVNVTIEEVDLLAKEQLKPEFIKVNPQHTVPTLVDRDFVLCESWAIATYLVQAYGKDDNLYPKDPQKRAVVNQMLYFDCTTLTPRINQITHPILFSGQDEVYDEHKIPLEEALGFLDIFLDEKNFVTGKTLTIADCFLIASISTIAAIGWDITPYGNINSWFARCSLEIPGYHEVNQEGAEKYGKLIKSKLASGKL